MAKKSSKTAHVLNLISPSKAEEPTQETPAVQDAPAAQEISSQPNDAVPETPAAAVVEAPAANMPAPAPVPAEEKTAEAPKSKPKSETMEGILHLSENTENLSLLIRDNLEKEFSLQNPPPKPFWDGEDVPIAENPRAVVKEVAPTGASLPESAAPAAPSVEDAPLAEIPAQEPLNEPVAPASPEPLNEPILSAAPEPLNEPVAPAASEPLNEPVAPAAPEPLNEPILPVASEPLNEPILPVAPEPLNEPILPVAPEPLNEPVVPIAPEPLNEPILPAAPEPLNEPILPVAPEPLNEPILPVAPEPLNEPVAPAAPEPLNEPAAPAAPEPLNEPILPVAPEEARESAADTPAESAPEPEDDGEPAENKQFCYTNVYERIVKSCVVEYLERFGVCTCSRCVADATALALTNLPSKYIVTDFSNIEPLLSIYEHKFEVAIMTELTKACFEVDAHPHHKL